MRRIKKELRNHKVFFYNIYWSMERLKTAKLILAGKGTDKQKLNALVSLFSPDNWIVRVTDKRKPKRKE